jgi:hypothetical protein
MSQPFSFQRRSWLSRKVDLVEIHLRAKAMVSSNVEYRLSPTVRITMDSTGGVLLDLARGKFYSLTFTAAEIIRALEGGARFDSLLELLQVKFQVPRKELEQDLARFLEEMERAELCRPSSESQSQA